MGALLDGALAIVLNLAAPENSLSRGVAPLQFEPDVEGVHGSSGEKVADFFGAYDDVDARRGTGFESGAGLIERRRHLAHLAQEELLRGLRLFANGERSHGLLRIFRRGAALHLHAGRFLGRRGGEDVHTDEARLQEALHRFQLGLILIGRGHGRVRRGETMAVDHAVARRRIRRGHERHMAAAAGQRLFGIVERTRALAGDAGGLPVVVLVEAAHPAIVVHRHVEVHLVTRRAELRRVAHERLHEGTAMRLGRLVRDEGRASSAQLGFRSTPDRAARDSPW